ncbi:hypothetical protein JCM8097_008011 [Rhodosporidiobolus ruineniae]
MSAPSLHSGDHEKAVDVHNDFASKPLDGPSFSAAEEKKLMRKIDYKLVPFLSLLYLLSFLDRVNIGMARLDGLEADLGLSGNDYQITLLVFFVGYVITEVPSNIFIKKLRPSRFIPAIMIIWSIVMTLMGLCTNFGGLVAARFFLGLSESALFPGICYYLICWYKREESQLRISIFFSSATLAGAFGGLLAYGIGFMGGIGGKGGWSWIFIIEGLMTFVVGCIAPFMIEDFPEDAKFLTERERAFVVHRLREDTGAAGEFRWRHVKAAFKDWKTYCYALIYIGVAEPLYSLSLFSPTLIANLGTWTRAQSQLLTVPPYALAFIVTLSVALLSDKYGQRAIVNITFMSLAIVGFIIQLAIDPRENSTGAYIGLWCCVVGVAPAIATTITWCGNNTAGVLKRGTAMGALFMTGNSGGIVSSVVYRTQDAPRYTRGHGTGLAFAAMAVILSTVMLIWTKRENARRDAKYGTVAELMKNSGAENLTQLHENPDVRRRLGIDHLSEEEIEALGDRHPLFRYLP